MGEERTPAIWAEKIVRALEEHDRQGDLFRQARYHLERARREGHDDTERHLRAIRAIWERSWFGLYEEALRIQGGLLLSAAEKDNIESRERIIEVYEDEIPSLTQALMALAICVLTIRQFSIEELLPVVQCRIVRSIPREEGVGNIIPVLEIGHNVYIPTVPGKPHAVFDFTPEVLIEGNELSLRIVLPDATGVVLLPARDLAVSALTDPKWQRSGAPFIMPRVIQELKGLGQGDEHFISIYLPSILAAALGAERLVYALGELFLQKKIKEFLATLGIRGDFVRRHEQVKLQQSRSCHNLPARNRDQLKERLHYSNDHDNHNIRYDHGDYADGLYLPCLVCMLERTNLSQILPDLTDYLARELMYRATIVKTDYVRQIVKARVATAYEVAAPKERIWLKDSIVRTTREFALELFLSIGPWLFRLEMPRLTDADDDVLVNSLTYSLVERTIPATRPSREGGRT